MTGKIKIKYGLTSLIRRLDKVEAEIVAQGWDLDLVRRLMMERRPAISPYNADEKALVIDTYREILPPVRRGGKREAA